LGVSGRIRLREEEPAQPLATLESGEWFGDLQQLSGSLVAASKKSSGSACGGMQPSGLQHL